MRSLRDGEALVLVVRQHWRTVAPVVGFGMVVAAATGFAVGVVGDPWQLWAAAAGSVVFLIFATRPLGSWWATRYLLTTERILVRQGMLARRGTEVPLSHVLHVHYEQTFAARLLGYGTVTIELAGERDDLMLDRIPDPEAFESAIWLAQSAPRRSGPADTEIL